MAAGEGGREARRMKSRKAENGRSAVSANIYVYTAQVIGLAEIDAVILRTEVPPGSGMVRAGDKKAGICSVSAPNRRKANVRSAQVHSRAGCRSHTAATLGKDVKDIGALFYRHTSLKSSSTVMKTVASETSGLNGSVPTAD